MSTLDNIKEKVEALKKKENDLSIREQVLSSIYPLYEVLEAKTKEKVANNNILVLEELSENIISSIKESLNLNEVTKHLEDLKSSLEDTAATEILEAIQQIVNEVKKIEEKTFFDQKQFQKIFTSGIDTIIGAIKGGEEDPTNTSYVRNEQNKIVKVIEAYNGYTIEYNWSYDQGGRLTNVKTIKNAKTP